MKFRKQFNLCILLILSVIFLCSCNSAVHENSGDIPFELAEATTYQEFYGALYEEILRNELLRQVYFPDISREMGIKILCGEPILEKGSYEEALYSLKEKNSAALSVENRKYSQGQNSPETRWIWQNNSGNIWENLLNDYSEIAPKYREAVTFFCDIGLALIEEDRSAYTLKLNPGKEISLQEAEKIRSRIYTYKREIPINAIETYDPDGNNILLCLSDSVSLFTFKNLNRQLVESGELLHSFVYYDATGTTVSFWIQSASGGVLSIPLDFAAGELCTFSYSGKTLAHHRISIISYMLPEEKREIFINDSESFLHERNANGTLLYEIGENSSAAMSVTFTSTGEQSGTVRLQCKNNL